MRSVGEKIIEEDVGDADADRDHTQEPGLQLHKPGVELAQHLADARHVGLGQDRVAITMRVASAQRMVTPAAPRPS